VSRGDREQALRAIGRTILSLVAFATASEHRFILFCDDLSFEAANPSYKSLKAGLEGGIEGRPDTVLLYATSNRRHLMPRETVENERSTAINPSEAVEEQLSLSDRFGLWIGPRGLAVHSGFGGRPRDRALVGLGRHAAHVLRRIDGT